jgi:hypothetical protein
MKKKIVCLMLVSGLMFNIIFPSCVATAAPPPWDNTTTPNTINGGQWFCSTFPHAWWWLAYSFPSSISYIPNDLVLIYEGMKIKASHASLLVFINYLKSGATSKAIEEAMKWGVHMGECAQKWFTKTVLIAIDLFMDEIEAMEARNWGTLLINIGKHGTGLKVTTTYNYNAMAAISGGPSVWFWKENAEWTQRPVVRNAVGCTGFFKPNAPNLGV